MRIKLLVILAYCFILACGYSSPLYAQEEKYKDAIYKESNVPKYVLPALLETFSGKKISSTRQWERVRRPEIMDFFAENMYGKIPVPSGPIKKSFKILKEDSLYLEGLCTKREVLVTIENSKGKLEMNMVVFIPNGVETAVPVIYQMSHNDVSNNKYHVSGTQNYGRTDNGVPLKQLMLRGIGLVGLDCGVFGDGGKSQSEILDGGIFDLFFESGQTSTKDDEWGLIAAWAYAMICGMDYIVTDEDINSKQVAALGCSIGGKVAIWAAAQDERIGMVLSATSGHGGDALWKRQVGETFDNMCEWLPRWPCRNAQDYAGRIDEMPVDQHMLLACLAPRPYYVATGVYDYWADPKGQWLATYHSSPVYKLYGKNVAAFDSEEQPSVNEPIVESQIGYHVRTGFHGLKLYDWERYMEFIEHHFLKIPIRSVHDIYHPDGRLLDHYPNMMRKSHSTKDVQ